jgi:Fe-S-cluster-containing dehydrogenase component
MFPENCMVGCNNCGVACLWNAISFPDLSYLKEVVERIPAGQVQKEFQKKISDNPSLIAAPSNASFSKL